MAMARQARKRQRSEKQLAAEKQRPAPTRISAREGRGVRHAPEGMVFAMAEESDQLSVATKAVAETCKETTVRPGGIFGSSLRGISGSSLAPAAKNGQRRRHSKGKKKREGAWSEQKRVKLTKQLAEEQRTASEPSLAWSCNQRAER